MTPGRYALVLGAFAQQRVVETAYSVRNERAMRRREPNAPRAAPTTFPLMVLIHAALFTLPWLEVRRRRSHRVPGVVQFAGWAGVLAAAALRFWVLATLKDRWTARALVPTQLEVATGGPYRWVRHPNYVAVALEFLALPLIGGAYWSAAGLSLANALVLWDRIRAEERLLDANPDYRRLMAGKPRFLPRWRGLNGRRGVRSTRGA